MGQAGGGEFLLGAAAQAVIDRTADLGIALEFAADSPGLVAVPLGELDLVPVAAASHPLGRIRRRVPLQALREERQLVLTDRSPLTRGRDFSVISTRTWRLADLGARHEMMFADLGWSSMPMHMVADDLVAGRLVRLDVRWPDGSRPPRPVAVLVRRRDKVLGPAGECLAERIVGTRAQSARNADTRRPRSSSRNAHCSRPKERGSSTSAPPPSVCAEVS